MKVSEKHNLAIMAAFDNGDWDKVLEILDLPYSNALRREREYGVLSLDFKKERDGSTGSLYDCLPSPEPSPLDFLEQKEREEELKAYINSLDEKDQQILYCYDVIQARSFTQISDLVGLSRQTVSKRVERIISRMLEISRN